MARAKAAKLVVLDSSDPISAETEAIQKRIRQRAFDLSQMRPPDAHELYDWIMAESQVISVPPVKVVEKDGKFHLTFAVAGVNPDDVNVMVSRDQILLKAESMQEENTVDGIVHMSDFKSATVFRSVSLPEPIDVNSAKVDFGHGLVHVSVAKEGAAETAPKRATTRKAPARKTRSKLP